MSCVAYFTLGVLVVAFPHCAVVKSQSLSFDGCDINDYYSALSSNTSLWTRRDLEILLKRTHRNVLPYTNSQTKLDVWRALMDLDEGESPDTVRLVYKNIDVNASEFGTATTWNREHLWPSSRGVNHEGADFTDVHHLRPSDWNVNAARSNLYFGGCGVAELESECRRPATREAANDTSSDGTAFGPPVIRRGDIARALFYMDIRYSGGADGESDLILSDCPDEQENVMGYLTQLLEWHEQDPPDDRERSRNDKVCENWQGNRNVFIDHPELVNLLFGSPRDLIGEGAGYECTLDPPPAGDDCPVGANASCASLRPGDIMTTQISSDDPDLFALVAMTDLPAGLKLYVTDNAWTGSSFRDNEGTIMLTVPSGGIANGTIFGYGSGVRYGNQWQRVSGSLSLSASGDTLITYCTEDDEGTAIQRNESPYFLSAISYSGDWMTSGAPESDYGTGSSALPDDLKNVAITLPHFDNYVYIGPRAGPKSEIQDTLRDVGNWDGTNSANAHSVVTTPFRLSGARSTSILFALVSALALPAIFSLW